MALSPPVNHNGYFINHIEDSPTEDLTVHAATPTPPGGLRVPSPTWRHDEASVKVKAASPPSPPSTSPSAHCPAPDFPQRRSSAHIIQAIEAANGNMGTFFRRASAPHHTATSHGKVNSLRQQFEKNEQEKIEQELLEAAANRDGPEQVPIYV